MPLLKLPRTCLVECIQSKNVKLPNVDKRDKCALYTHFENDTFTVNGIVSNVLGILIVVVFGKEIF